MNGVMTRGAVVSECLRYRYLLERHWDTHKPACGFLMLNPSIADEMTDDPTIRRCIGFAMENGFGAIYVGNLFAYQATDPKLLPDNMQTAMGPRRNFFLWRMGMASQTIVAAWGSSLPKFVTQEFLNWTLTTVGQYVGPHIKCLGTTKNGQPRHPLYVRRDQPLIDYVTPK